MSLQEEDELGHGGRGLQEKAELGRRAWSCGRGIVSERVEPSKKEGCVGVASGDGFWSRGVMIG